MQAERRHCAPSTASVLCVHIDWNPLAAFIHGPLSIAATAEGTYGQTR